MCGTADLKIMFAQRDFDPRSRACLPCIAFSYKNPGQQCAQAGMTMRSLSAIPSLQRRLNSRLPFYYGWVILGCLCCAGFARQGPAVATLSIFVEPLSREFGWSRAALSGAVSLGGVLAALASPLIGPMLDRQGSRLVLCAAVLVNGIALMALSLTGSLAVFYLLFCLARMNWAAPFELGVYGALNN